jgi:hypothetical protein
MRAMITVVAGIAYLGLLSVVGPRLAQLVLGPHEPWMDAMEGFLLLSIIPVIWLAWTLQTAPRPMPIRVRVLPAVVATLIVAGVISLSRVPTGPGSSTAAVAILFLPGYVIVGAVLVDCVWWAVEQFVARRRA